ncbi:hypothetical protein, partial [Microbispora hainanensis]|uniref:hypothetical protein n=1 Tax=Microbispora hainanensis TaxID=568844 RepID=UPI001ABEEF33
MDHTPARQVGRMFIVPEQRGQLYPYLRHRPRQPGDRPLTKTAPRPPQLPAPIPTLRLRLRLAPPPVLMLVRVPVLRLGCGALVVPA